MMLRLVLSLLAIPIGGMFGAFVFIVLLGVPMMVFAGDSMPDPHDIGIRAFFVIGAIVAFSYVMFCVPASTLTGLLD